MNPAISVIVPVYNVEAYVRKSLQSIADQTFTDWECIVVDDGSTDGSGAICDEFAACDPRFRVIHQSNMGLSGARNTGLAVAQGRYIGFLDSDDYIHPDMYQVLLTAIQQTNADIAIVQSRKVNNLDEPLQSNPPVKYRVMNRMQVFHYWFVEPFRSSWMEPVWNKLYRQELIGDELFADVVPAEDREFNTRLYLKCSCAVVINQVLHHYFQRQGSIIDRSEQNFNETTDASHALVVLKSMEPIGFHLGAMTEKERGFFYIRYMKCYLLARLLIKHKSEVQPLLSSFKADVKTHFFSDATIPLIYKTVMGVMFFIPITYYVFLRVNEWRVKLMNNFAR